MGNHSAEWVDYAMILKCSLRPKKIFNKKSRDWLQVFAFKWLFHNESAKLRGLRGNMGYVGSWVAWAHGLRGSHFYVGGVGCGGRIYFCVGQNYLRGSIFLRGSSFFPWLKIFWVSKFLRGSIFFVVGLKKSRLTLSHLHLRCSLNTHRGYVKSASYLLQF